MEMNLHAPQSYEAAVELEEIAAVPHQIITPRLGTPVISIVQDTLVGAYRVSRPNITFNLREFMNLMIYNRRFNGIIQAPRSGKRYTGHQLVSQLLPPINMNMKNGLYKDFPTEENIVKIQNGDILQGTLDNGVFSKASAGIIHVTYNDYGSQQTVDLIDGLQNMLESFLIMNGLSVGISDLIADEKTYSEMKSLIESKTRQVEEIILQVHMDLFDNNSGGNNKQEFENRVLSTLNKATDDAGTAGVSSLAADNRLMSMVRSGSKGKVFNVAQMMACVGQQNIEGKRIQDGFTDRTLPHFKKYDDGAKARGFIESSFIGGLDPEEFFFHAMSGREGLIDTAVKSVTADTPIVVQIEGKTKYTTIGELIDGELAKNNSAVQHFDERQMEYLDLNTKMYIPTGDADGNVTWGAIKAVTRHDPGNEVYEVISEGGRKVIVSESQSLLIWNMDEQKFVPIATSDVKVGDWLPVTAKLCDPPVLTKTIQVADYLPKNEFLYGTDFMKATQLMENAMEGRSHIPSGWWDQNNGSSFTLPYDSKARLQRATVRSNISNINEGYVYPFTTNREHSRIPDELELNERNGIMIGLFLAEGNVDIKSGYVQITNNDEEIRNFANTWFQDLGVSTKETIKENKIGGTSSDIRGYSTILAQLFDRMCGHGAGNKRVPDEAFAAPKEFIIGLLNGYFSGDGTISENSIDVGSASSVLIDGISMLCNRLNIFGKMSKAQLKSNNVGTENILPTYRLAIRAQWATSFAAQIKLIDANKQQRLNALNASESHRNFMEQNDMVLDRIKEINVLDVAKYPKLYDFTVPSTYNFIIANGLNCRDTADTGYIQRKLIKGMEDIVVHHDGTVRDANMNIVQTMYGEDGINATKVEKISYDLGSMSRQDVEKVYGLAEADFTNVLMEGVEREADESAMKKFVGQILEDRKMQVEQVNKMTKNDTVVSPVNLSRLIETIKVRFGIKKDDRTDLTPKYVLTGIERILEQTQNFSALWAALLRYYLAPHKIIINERFSKKAFDTLSEVLIIKNWQSWVVPGEQVGILAAQSIGEPSTQMVLNTFHTAGASTNSKVSGGLPRLRELLSVTKDPAASSLTIYLRDEYKNSRDKAREVSQELELTMMRDITKSCAIYYDPKDETTILEEDRALIEFYKLFESGTGAVDPKKSSPWLVRLEFDREKMFNKNISMYDVAFILRDKFEDIELTYSDYNAQKLIMRIRIPMSDTVDAVVDLKKFQNKLLNGVILRGSVGLKSVTFIKQKAEFGQLEEVDGVYKSEAQYVLETDGSNFLDVANHPAVNGNKLYSTNFHDIYEQLGMEAARVGLLREFTKIFEEVGVSQRHLCLMVDIMTRNGVLMSMDRYGINKQDTGPLAKASFETTADTLIKACYFGEVDPMKSVSANIMMGQPIRGGTSFSQILLDESSIVNMYKGLAPVEEYGEEEEIDYSKLTEEEITYLGDECSAAKMQLSAVLPPAMAVQDEEDIELNILE